MQLYEEQIRQRIDGDDESFQSAFAQMVGVVMGKKVSAALNDHWQIAKNAIDEILKYYHIRPQDVPPHITDRREQLEYQLRPSGVMHSAVRLKKGWYRSAIGPMLGVSRADGSAVALLPSAFFGYRYYDKGVWRTVNRRTQELFEDEAVCFYRPLPAEELTPFKLLKFSAGVIARSDLAAVAAATLAFTLLGLLIPKLSNFLISTVIPMDSINLLASTALFLLCVSLAIPLLESVKKLLVSRVGSKMDVAVRSAAYMRLLCLPAAFFKEHSSGALASRMQMLEKLCTVLTTAVLDTGLSAVLSLIYVAQIFRYAPQLAAPAVFVLAASVGFSALTAARKVKNMGMQIERAAKTDGLSFSLISGIQKIKLSGSEKRVFARWAQAYSQEADVIYNPGAVLKLRTVIAAAISLTGTFFIYLIAARTGVDVADYYAFHTAYSMVAAAFLLLSEVAFLGAQVKPVTEAVEPILKAVPETAGGKRMVTELSGNVELSRVSFRYREDMPLILDDLSIRIPAGQYVAIVGRTGCGKSTLLRLLLGFETPQKGAVYYDGQDITGFDLRSLRRHIGVVTQNGDLFAGDIYSNITVSAPGLRMEDAWEAAEMAGIAEDIRHMPMGMRTHLSEGAGGISGGQKQRLMIARAIAAKPRILMLDEATSALDNITQKQVSDSLGRLRCTRIVIAHRLSTIRQCDRIIVLDAGKIVEDGGYDELIQKDGFFAELVRRQQL